MKAQLLAFGVTLLVAVAAHADTLVLKNGRRITGHLVGIAGSEIQFEDRSGRFRTTVRIPRDLVVRVEFGLTESKAGLRIYGAGIVSSRAESVFALDDPSPNRLGFDLERVMRTPYRIDDFQQVYFVIPSLQALLDATLQDFAPIYERLAGAEDIPIDAIVPQDRVFNCGTQAYARAKTG